MQVRTKIVLLIAVVIGSILLFSEQFKDVIKPYIDSGEFLTLEARITPAEIMQTYKNELLGDKNHSFQEPSTVFHPYLLMEVKYTQADQKTREGVILWGLLDGEMVMNTDTWEKTHGFHDAILVDANRNDFRIMQAIAKSRGQLSKEQLQKELRIESSILDNWLESAKYKQLIVQSGNDYLLHFQNPKILVNPHTRITKWFVSKPYTKTHRLPKRFSRKQIEKGAKGAFGSDFTIRNASEVYLPVYTITVQNPDGTTLTSEWNAITGQRIPPTYLK